MSISAQQSRMARAALNIGIRELAKLANVSPNTVARLERGEVLHARTRSYLRGALEAAGITFVDSGSISPVGGPGVRIGGASKSPLGYLFDRLWESTPLFRAQPRKAYALLLNALSQYLDVIQREGREPDAWERIDLNDALLALNRSDVFSAFAYLLHAITPPDDQSTDYPIATETAASTAEFNLTYFRRCIAALTARDYQGVS